MFDKILLVHKDKLPDSSLADLEKIKEILKDKKLLILGYNEFSHRHANNFDLIITLGGDGTFVKAANLIKNSLILGINSNPLSSEGALTSLSITDLEQLKNIIHGKFQILERQRARITLNGKILDEQATNEVYIGSISQFHSSRYKIKFKEKEEEQRSSGIIISTGTGSTAWFKSAGGKPFDSSEKKLAFLVREPYSGERLFKSSLLSGEILSGEKIIIESLRDFGGVLSINDSIFDFNNGDIAQIELSDQPLRVVTKRHQEYL